MRVAFVEIRRQTVQPPPPAETAGFLAQGGDVARLIGAYAWGATSLGDIAGWPPHLTSVVGLTLRSPVPIVTLWGEDGVMIYNDAYSAFAGARHPHLLGSKVREGWPEVADFNDNVMRVCLAGGTLAYRDQELTLSRRGVPEPVWMNLDYSPLLGASGEPVGVIAIVVETTAKVQAERRLRETAAALTAANRDLADRARASAAERDRMWLATRDLLAVVDEQGIFRAANPAWQATLGYPLEELVGRSFRDLVVPEDLDATAEAAARATAGQPLDDFLSRFRHRNGEVRWISWRTTTEARLIYAYGRDVTADRSQEAALRQAEAALRQSQKMEAVGQLTGGLAHDFNNLLTGVLGSLEMIGIRIGQGRIAETDTYVTAAIGAGRRAAALTHRLLAFSRRQTLAPRAADIDALVESMEELIRRTMGPEIAVEVIATAAPWIAMIDPPQLESALLNLCLNARDAMTGGGKLTIETGTKWLDAQAGQERDLPPGHYVTLCVSDTGTGMAAEVRDRAFDPFFTTKPLGLGTGLGLSMVYGFIRQSGGAARIYSEPGQGAMVCLYLPRHFDTGLDVAMEVPETPAPPQTAGCRILVVDDEAAVRMLIVDVVNELGHLALEAADGAQALRLLRSDARIDLLVSDVGLPGGMNGRQLADAARAARPLLPILFVTGYAENAVVSHGHLDAGMHVLTKPFALKTIGERIATLLASTPTSLPA